MDADTAHLERYGYRQELRRALGLFDVFAAQVSLISVSGGIFLLFQWGLTTSGPAFCWAWILGGLLQLSVGLSIAELASAYPLAGSCYNWIRRLYAGALAWMAGYILIVAHISAVAFVDYAVAPYLLSFVGVGDPSRGQILAVAIACLALQTVVNLLSVGVSSLVTNVRTVVELAGIVALVMLLIIVGLRHNPTLLFNATGTAIHEHMPPFLLVLLGPASIISSFDSTANLSEELKKPQVNAPLGAMAANLVGYICGTALIVVPLLAMTNLARTMREPLPLLYIMQTRLGIPVATIFEAIMIATLCVASLMMQLTAARILWAQARDGALPGARWLYRLDREGVPAAAVLLCTGIVALFWLWLPAMGYLVALGTEAWAVAYGVTVAAGLYAKIQGRLPLDRGWNLGRWGMSNDVVALSWSVALVVLLPLMDISHVLPGFVLAVVVGLLGYTLWGKPRGKLPWLVGRISDS